MARRGDRLAVSSYATRDPCPYRNAPRYTTQKETNPGSRREGGYLDGLTELLEASDEASGLNGFGSAVEVVGTEIVVEGAVLEHMVGGGQDRGGEGADRHFRAVP